MIATMSMTGAVGLGSIYKYGCLATGQGDDEQHDKAGVFLPEHIMGFLARVISLCLAHMVR